jgi:hypothetical protein
VHAAGTTRPVVTVTVVNAIPQAPPADVPWLSRPLDASRIFGRQDIRTLRRLGALPPKIRDQASVGRIGREAT